MGGRCRCAARKVGIYISKEQCAENSQHRRHTLNFSINFNYKVSRRTTTEQAPTYSYKFKYMISCILYIYGKHLSLCKVKQKKRTIISLNLYILYTQREKTKGIRINLKSVHTRAQIQMIICCGIVFYVDGGGCK